jgi:NADH:ubiquinone oxidoreductase subunit 6 (subunit J)
LARGGEGGEKRNMIIINLLILITASISIMINNPIMSVVYLVSVYIFSSLLFIILGYDFVGIIYIIVYVGAIAILLLFVIMMMNLFNISPSKSIYSFRSPLLLRSILSSSENSRENTINTSTELQSGNIKNGSINPSISESTISNTDIGSRLQGRQRPILAILSIVAITSLYHYVNQFNHSTITVSILNITPTTWLKQITMLDHTTWLLSIITSWDTLTITILSPLLFSIGFILYSDGAILLLLLSILLLMVMISIIGLISPSISSFKSPSNTSRPPLG